MYLTTTYYNEELNQEFNISTPNTSNENLNYLKEKNLKLGKYYISAQEFRLTTALSLNIQPSAPGVLMMFLLDGEQYYSHHIIKEVKNKEYTFVIPPSKETTKQIFILIPQEVISDLKEELLVDLKFNNLSPTITITDITKHNSLLSTEMKSVLIDINACQRSGSFKQVYLERKIAELLFLQLENMTYDKSLLHITDVDKERMHQARELIVQNITCPCSLTNLAKQVGTNEFKLKKFFKEIFGNTVFGYLNDYKMTKAKEMLQDADLTISEVADNLGFKSQNHFSTVFKKHYGYSPSEIKKNIVSLKEHVVNSLQNARNYISIFFIEIIESTDLYLYSLL